MRNRNILDNKKGLGSLTTPESSQSENPKHRKLIMSNKLSQTLRLSSKPINGEVIKTVNARDLHSFLGSKQEFSTWIKSRINQYEFVENQDFISFDNFVKRDNGGSVRIEYCISTDMAKELSMVERSEKGKQARRYFIECEKKSLQPVQLPQDLPSALRLAADLAEQNEQLTLDKQKAIREKGQISESREASVMGKLGQAVKKICRLENQIGDSETYKQAKAIPWLSNYFNLDRVAYQQIGKKLTAVSDEIGEQPIRISDSQYDNVKAYHVNAIEEFRAKLDSCPTLLHKYRKEGGMKA